MKILEFANSVDPDEVAHNEPPHLGLHCLPSSLSNFQYDIFFFHFADVILLLAFFLAF